MNEVFANTKLNTTSQSGNMWRDILNQQQQKRAEAMKLVYQANDGKTFDDFDKCKEHEVTELDNIAGEMIDKSLKLSDNPTQQKLNTLNFLVDNRLMLARLLKKYDTVLATVDVDYDLGLPMAGE